MLFDGIPVFGMPGSDDFDKLFIRCPDGASELAAPQIHACDAVAVRTMAGGARRQKEPAAVLNIGCGVLVLRRQRGHCSQGHDETQNAKQK
jgi:hypothetical protein